jgi:hypothetical protein
VPDAVLARFDVAFDVAEVQTVAELCPPWAPERIGMWWLASLVVLAVRARTFTHSLVFCFTLSARPTAFTMVGRMVSVVLREGAEDVEEPRAMPWTELFTAHPIFEDVHGLQ